jgi:hypothetical protein
VKRFPKSDVHVLSAFLSFCILLGSIPLSTGIEIASHPKQVTFTLNICEPLQAALGGSGTPIARPATSPPRLILLERGRVSANPPKPLTDLSIPPEIPPPKVPV